MNWLKGLAGTNIKSIIDEYAPYDVETGFDGFKKTINEIRKNHLLRCRLLEFFGRKLEVMRQLSPDDLPERVKHNDPGNLKHPNHPGYPDKMTSPEYAAVVADKILLSRVFAISYLYYFIVDFSLMFCYN